MKKPRHFLLVFTSLTMAAFMVFAVACEGCGKSCGDNPTPPEPDPVLTSIALDYSGAKTEYLVGDDFSTDGLEITASFDKGEAQTVYDGDDGVRVDSSAYNKDSVGKYEIKVTYTLGEVSKESSYFVYVNEVALSIDASAAKKQFIVNDEDFTTDGLKVYRTLTTNDGVKTEEIAESDYTIFKNGFDKTKTGTYTITIQYEYIMRLFREEYEVKVTEARQGIEVAFTEEAAEKEVFTLSGTKDAVATADLSGFASWVTARKADKFGNVPADAAALDLTAEGTTVKLYEGTREVTDASALSNGVYTIQVEVADKDAAGNDVTLCGFVNVWVVDNLKSLTFKDTAENTKTTQLAGKDIISKTWQFVATYESGREETITAADKNIKIENLKTTEATEEAGSVATVSFTSVNSKLEETTKTAEVTYIVNPLTGIQNYELTYKVENKAWTSQWKDDFEGASSQLSITPTAQASVKENDWSEVKNSADKYVTVVVGSDAKNVTISAIMKTSNASRHFYITTDLTAVVDNKVAEVTPEATNTEYELKAENVAAGTYYITSLTKDDTIKIHSVTVTYKVNYDGDSGESQSTTSTISFGELTTGKDLTSIAGIGNLTVDGTAVASEKVSLVHTTTDKFSIKETSGTIPGTEYSYTKSFNTGGGSRITRRSIKVELEDNCTYTVTVYANGNGTADTRHVSIYQGTGTSDMTEANGATIGAGLAASDISASTFENITSANGALYIGGDASINIYYIVVIKTSNSSSSQPTTSSILFNELVKGDYTTDISGIGNLTIDGTALTSASVSFAHTKDKMTVKEGSGTIAGTEYSYTKYLNTAGASRTIRRSIKIELEEGYTYTVTVYANGNGTADARHVSIYQGTSEKDMTEANGATIGAALAATDISASTFENITSAAGALYIGGDANINIFCIVITKTAVN